jgi:hypothetical protein
MYKKSCDSQGFLNNGDLPPGCGNGGHKVHIDTVTRNLGMLPSMNGKRVWVELTEETFSGHMLGR